MSTSGDRRILIASLGAAAFGRPRRTSLPPSYTSACAKNSAVNSGASSGSTHFFFPELLFLGMSVPHRHDVPRIAARRPHKHHHPAREMACGDEPGFVGLSAVRRTGGMKPGEDLGGIREIEPPLPQRPLALGGIEGDPHRKLCIYNNCAVQDRSVKNNAERIDQVDAAPGLTQ